MLDPARPHPECRALLELYNHLRRERTAWAQGIHAVLFTRAPRPWARARCAPSVDRHRTMMSSAETTYGRAGLFWSGQGRDDRDGGGGCGHCLELEAGLFQQEPVLGLGTLPAGEHAQHGQVDHLGHMGPGAVGDD
jgi:hypothetical protein